MTNKERQRVGNEAYVNCFLVIIPSMLSYLNVPAAAIIDGCIWNFRSQTGAFHNFLLLFRSLKYLFYILCYLAKLK